MIKILFIAIKRMAFLILRPFLFLFAQITCNWDLAQKIEWKRRHGYINVWKTIVVNFSSFKPSMARKLPIIVYENLDFINNGRIVIEADNITQGMIKINPITWRSKSNTRIENNGTILLLGDKIRVFGGAKIIIKNGVLTLKEGSTICENVILFCEHKISIGIRSDLSFNTIITDTNNHFIVDMETGNIAAQRKDVEIGDFNWIGNNASIKPGTKTPHHTIVASSYSVLTKDYTKIISPYSVIGGCPAKLLKENVSRIWNVKVEMDLWKHAAKGEPLFIEKDKIEDAITSLNNY